MREKVKLEVKKFRLEINNVDFHLLFIFKTAIVCTIGILMLYLLSLFIMFIMFLVCITNECTAVNTLDTELLLWKVYK